MNKVTLRVGDAILSVSLDEIKYKAVNEMNLFQMSVDVITGRGVLHRDSVLAVKYKDQYIVCKNSIKSADFDFLPEKCLPYKLKEEHIYTIE